MKPVSVEGYGKIHEFDQLPSLRPEEDLQAVTAELDSPTPIPWTRVFRCNTPNSKCNSLPLSDPGRCVRYLGVHKFPDAKKYAGSVLTFAPDDDRLPPKVIFSISYLYSSNSPLLFY